MIKKPLQATRRRVDAPNKGNEYLVNWIPKMQLKTTIALSIQCEEKQFFKDKLAEIAELTKNMPGPRGQDDIADPTVYLHYFFGGSDWYILERDSSNEQHQCFGWAILNGDTWNAELGYISINELMSVSAMQLDYHWTPKPLSEVKRSKGR